MSLKKRIFNVIIVLIFLFTMIFIAKSQTGITIKENSFEIANFGVPESTAYYVIATPKKEITVIGQQDISEITEKLSFVGYAYNFSGDFQYGMILSCIDANRISQCNFLIKDNYMVNGNMVFKLDFNLEDYLKTVMISY